MMLNIKMCLRVCVVGCALWLSSCGMQAPSSLSNAQAPNAQQEVFATPQDAVDALVDATRNDNKAALTKILGPRAEVILHSGDKVANEQGRESFLAAYDKAHEIENESSDRALLIVGDEQWPMPTPLVRAPQGWWFDTAAGEQEILNRRIGRNELNVAEICRTYVEAQKEFAKTNPDHEFAQHFQSARGQHNGLYWQVAEGQPESPFGPLIAAATAEGYSGNALSKRTPYHGYYYKILKRQGPHAGGGKRNYVVKGHMTRGFALISFPARYGNSGVMTFIVNQSGVVYEKNLGLETNTIASRMTSYDPDSSWKVVLE